MTINSSPFTASAGAGWSSIDNATDLRLVHFNLNPEIFAPEGSRGRLGLALRDVRVELLGR